MAKTVRQSDCRVLQVFGREMSFMWIRRTLSIKMLLMIRIGQIQAETV